MINAIWFRFDLFEVPNEDFELIFIWNINESLSTRPRAITRDKLDTLFKKASSIINNTPLYQISVDPNDPFPICPASLMLLKDNPNPLAL